MSIEMSDPCGLKNNEISLQQLHYKPWLLHSKVTSLKITDGEDQTKVQVPTVPMALCNRIYVEYQRKKWKDQ